MRANSGYTTNALGDLLAGTHVFGRTRHELMFQALIFKHNNILSTRCMGHNTLLIWLGVSKVNDQLYTISKQTSTLFEGV